jgi:PUA domain protein
VDRGAIKFILGGADCMAPGLTSKGGFLPEDLDEGEVVSVFCEGKVLPVAVGILTMSSAEIREKNSGVAIKMLHVMGDGLWHTPELR